jgi:hypothetical protein
MPDRWNRLFGSMVPWADLAPHHAPASQRHHNFTMAQILFTCPTVSMKVQHWLDEDHCAKKRT